MDFRKIFEEEHIPNAEQVAEILETAAFTLSGGERTRDYRTRMNTVKMRLKGTRGMYEYECRPGNQESIGGKHNIKH